MTTIAWDGKTLAADTYSLINWMPCTDRGKIWKNENGLFGQAGDKSLSVKIRRLAPHQLHEGMPKEWFADSSAVWVRNGKCYHAVNGEWLESPVPFAIGSGKDFAIAAMDFGKTAAEAVKYAMTRDYATGGDVVTLEAA